MRILLLTWEVWNDLVSGNNVLQNWFSGMKDVEFAQICMSPGKPYNSECTKYFQTTDSEIAKSYLGKKAGHSFIMSKEEMAINPQKVGYMTQSPFYSFMKKISGPALVLFREVIWQFGRYNETELEKFIKDFNPDIVFSPRYLKWSIMRLEKIVRKYTDAPFVAYTGDDETLSQCVSKAFLYRTNRYFFRRAFKKHSAIYSHYFTHSKDQAKELNEMYGFPTSVIFKGGKFPSNFTPKEVGSPIRMVYAGKLYCNRWKTLHEIGKSLNILNEESVKMVLDIYTQDKITVEQAQAFSESNFININNAVSPTELEKIYHKADIALHVESFDRINRLNTKFSFSTKIIDLMASSCAIMAICWEEHTGYKYLHENNVAFCISDYNNLLGELQRITTNPTLIKEYAQKAYDFGIKNHTRDKIQKQIFDTFSKIILESHHK